MCRGEWCGGELWVSSGSLSRWAWWHTLFQGLCSGTAPIHQTDRELAQGPLDDLLMSVYACLDNVSQGHKNKWEMVFAISMRWVCWLPSTVLKSSCSCGFRHPREKVWFLSVGLIWAVLFPSPAPTPSFQLFLTQWGGQLSSSLVANSQNQSNNRNGAGQSLYLGVSSRKGSYLLLSPFRRKSLFACRFTEMGSHYVHKIILSL